jgi:excinuclease ABC subunit C
MNKIQNLDPELSPDEEDEDATLPIAQSAPLSLAEPAESLAAGREALARYARHAPSSPGVYRMIDAAGEVLYVGKAKNVQKRVLSYLRPTGHEARIAQMIAATSSLEFVSTRTETEALLLEANLIKRLRPRFNVLLRDDKSFPYILITANERAAQIIKHRGARNQAGEYFGPFASAWAVNRTITALERAFLLRSCSDAVFDSRTRPCLLHQIKRCSAPCTGEISPSDYSVLTDEARAFLSGRSRAMKEQLAREMDAAASAMDYERAAICRDRLAALSAIQTTQGINPRTLENADVFAAHQEGGFTCVQVFFFRAGQNWGNRAYFPRADRSLSVAEVLEPFLAQFYEDKPSPRLVLLSHAVEDMELLASALGTRSGHKVEINVPQRGEKKELVEHALANAREALARKLADVTSQNRLLEELQRCFKLPHKPQRIEVYDNSHIQGSNAVGAMIVAGPEGFKKNQYRKFNIRSAELAPGDDYGMMREVLTRRFKRLMEEAPRGSIGGAPDAESPWPDLVLIDGGQGQLNAALETLTALGVEGVALAAIAKGPDRDAGRETFFIPGLPSFKLPARDPLLYFVERMRDEAHRFAVGSHRQKRSRGLREGGLQEIPGIGPTRKRALLHHFGTLKAIERASPADLAQVSGINEESARRIYDFFHPNPQRPDLDRAQKANPPSIARPNPEARTSIDIREEGSG